MTKRKGFAIGLAVSQAMIILPLLFWLLQYTPAAYAADWNVNIFADVSDGDCEDGSCSLRDAINLAAALDTIYLPAGSYTLTLGEISTGKTITLIGQGAGAADTIIDGNFASRLFSISSGTVTFSNLTLQNGEPASGSGGAISAIVIADTDFLIDGFWVQVQNFFGQRIANAFAGNGDTFGHQVFLTGVV